MMLRLVLKCQSKKILMLSNGLKIQRNSSTMPLRQQKLIWFFLTKRTVNVRLLSFLTIKLSLAIGRRGQNVRLAAHLTGYRIDIKSASEYEALEAEHEANAAVTQEEVAPVEEAAESVEN